MASSNNVIAIDGPAASGKSSVARELASRLTYLHVNSGAMYRALTWSVLGAGVSPDDPAAVIAHMHSVEIACGEDDGTATLTVDGVDPGDELTSPGVNAAVSAVSRVPEVREVLVAKQRDYQSVGNIVMEGRDIGSVVFPDTAFKFYIDASEEVRAARRRGQGIDDDLAKRDAADSGRAASPLTVAPDALVIDTSELAIPEVVARVIESLRERGLADIG